MVATQAPVDILLSLLGAQLPGFKARGGPLCGAVGVGVGVMAGCPARGRVCASGGGGVTTVCACEGGEGLAEASHPVTGTAGRRSSGGGSGFPCTDTDSGGTGGCSGGVAGLRRWALSEFIVQARFD